MKREREAPFYNARLCFPSFFRRWFGSLVSLCAFGSAKTYSPIKGKYTKYSVQHTKYQRKEIINKGRGTAVGMKRNAFVRLFFLHA